MSCIDVEIEVSSGNGIVILMRNASALIVPHNLKCKHLAAGGGLTLSGTSCDLQPPYHLRYPYELWGKLLIQVMKVYMLFIVFAEQAERNRTGSLYYVL